MLRWFVVRVGAVGLLIMGCARPTERKPVGAAPTLFAFGAISGVASNLGPAFDPDCGTVFFGRTNGTDDVIVMSTLTGRDWSAARVAPFSGIWRDLEPSMSPDGSRLAFASNRPQAPGGDALDGAWDGKKMPSAGGNLWYVERRGEGWSAPQRYPDVINSTTSVFTPSIAGNGNVYFMKASSESGLFHLYRSVWKDGAYQPAERLPFSEGEQWRDVDPAVASDESYLVFSSGRPPAAPGDVDLFIAVRSAGVWSEPRHLGPAVNSPSGDIEARLAPDDHTLYFTSRRAFPMRYPQSPESSAARLREMSVWNTGLQHIWRVDIAPQIAGAGGRVPVRPGACTPI